MKLKAIAIRPDADSEMEEVDSVEITTEHGLKGDSRGKPGRRQISIQSDESWTGICKKLKKDLPWTDRRANILVEGLEFNEEHIGKLLKIGNVALVVCMEIGQLSQESDAIDGLTDELLGDFRGGICCKVVTPGTITVGDAITV